MITIVLEILEKLDTLNHAELDFHKAYTERSTQKYNMYIRMRTVLEIIVVDILNKETHTGGEGYTLEQCIQELDRLKLLDERSISNAHTIRRRSNKVVHEVSIEGDVEADLREFFKIVIGYGLKYTGLVLDKERLNELNDSTVEMLKTIPQSHLIDFSGITPKKNTQRAYEIDVFENEDMYKQRLEQEIYEIGMVHSNREITNKYYVVYKIELDVEFDKTDKSPQYILVDRNKLVKYGAEDKKIFQLLGGIKNNKGTFEVDWKRIFIKTRIGHLGAMAYCVKRLDGESDRDYLERLKLLSKMSIGSILLGSEVYDFENQRIKVTFSQEMRLLEDGQYTCPTYGWVSAPAHIAQAMYKQNKQHEWYIDFEMIKEEDTLKVAGYIYTIYKAQKYAIVLEETTILVEDLAGRPVLKGESGFLSPLQDDFEKAYNLTDNYYKGIKQDKEYLITSKGEAIGEIIETLSKDIYLIKQEVMYKLWSLKKQGSKMIKAYADSVFKAYQKFPNGYCLTSEKGTGLIDYKGQVILPFEFDKIQYEEDMGIRATKDGKVSLYDLSGKSLTEYLDYGISKVKRENEYILTNEMGQQVGDIVFTSITRWNNQNYVYTYSKGKGIINLKTQEIKEKLEDFQALDGTYAKVRRNEREYLLNKDYEAYDLSCIQEGLIDEIGINQGIKSIYKSVDGIGMIVEKVSHTADTYYYVGKLSYQVGECLKRLDISNYIKIAQPEKSTSQQEPQYLSIKSRYPKFLTVFTVHKIKQISYLSSIRTYEVGELKQKGMLRMVGIGELEKENDAGCRKLNIKLCANSKIRNMDDYKSIWISNTLEMEKLSQKQFEVYTEVSRDEGGIASYQGSIVLRWGKIEITTHRVNFEKNQAEDLEHYVQRLNSYEHIAVGSLTTIQKEDYKAVMQIKIAPWAEDLRSYLEESTLGIYRAEGMPKELEEMQLECYVKHYLTTHGEREKVCRQWYTLVNNQMYALNCLQESELKPVEIELEEGKVETLWVSKKGNVYLIPHNKDEIKPLNKFHFMQKTDKGWQILKSPIMEPINPIFYEEVIAYKPYYYKVIQDGKHYLLDEYFTEIGEFIPFKEQALKFIMKKKACYEIWEIIEDSYDTLEKVEVFNHIQFIEQGYIVQQEQQWGYLNHQGKLSISLKYDTLTWIKQDVFKGAINSQEELINQEGKRIGKLFTKDIYQRKEGDKWRLINALNEPVLAHLLSEIEFIRDGLWQVKIDGQDYLLDKDLEILSIQSFLRNNIVTHIEYVESNTEDNSSGYLFNIEDDCDEKMKCFIGEHLFSKGQILSKEKLYSEVEQEIILDEHVGYIPGNKKEVTYLISVVEVKEIYIVVEVKEIIYIPEVEQIRTTFEKNKLYIDWIWPETIDEVHIAYSQKEYPKAVREENVKHKIMSRKDYEAHGQVIIKHLEANTYYLTLFTMKSVAGENQYSIGTRIEIAEQEGILKYYIKKKRHLFGTSKNEVIIENKTGIQSKREIIGVVQRDHVPVNKEDGEIILVITPEMIGENKKVNIPIDHHTLKGYFRLFFNTAEAKENIKLVPVDYKRLKIE